MNKHRKWLSVDVRTGVVTHCDEPQHPFSGINFTTVPFPSDQLARFKQLYPMPIKLTRWQRARLWLADKLVGDLRKGE